MAQVFCEAEKGVAAISAGVASGSAADLSFDDLTADVVFRSVGVERDFGTVEDDEQLGLVGVKAFEQLVELGETGATLEDGVEALRQFGLCAGLWLKLVGLEIVVERPDQVAQRLLRHRRACSVNVSSLWTRRSACTQQSAWRPTLNCPASSLTTTVVARKPWALTAPKAAPSVAIRTGSG